ncbi:MAG: 50S ribosomal protein L32 [Chloroflexi bacterium]|nr:50S ribosomal protein L32 [Chloroflexota bacterium]
MPPLPKRRLSRARRGDGRSHMRLSSTALALCPQCHNPKLPHRVCPTCGTYKGREVIKIESEKA